MTVEAIARAGYEAWSGQRWADMGTSRTAVIWMRIAEDACRPGPPMTGLDAYEACWDAQLVSSYYAWCTWDDELDEATRQRWQRAAEAMNEAARELIAPAAA